MRASLSFCAVTSLMVPISRCGRPSTSGSTNCPRACTQRVSPLRTLTRCVLSTRSGGTRCQPVNSASTRARSSSCRWANQASSGSSKWLECRPKRRSTEPVSTILPLDRSISYSAVSDASSASRNRASLAASAASVRRRALMSRACRHMTVSPVSRTSTLLVTSAATSVPSASRSVHSNSSLCRSSPRRYSARQRSGSSCGIRLPMRRPIRISSFRARQRVASRLA